MINAAEPVDGPSLDAFAATFRPLGLKCPAPSPSVGEGKEKEDGVVFPTYGLAEHTVFVCGGGASAFVVMCDVCPSITIHPR